LDAATAIPKHLAAAPLFAPGADYAYSNVGYAVLAAVVEAVSGQSLEAYCRERVFARAGLVNTSFCGSPLARAEAALGYSSRSEEPRTPWIDPYSPADEFGYEYRGMGGVVSNVIDLRRWIHALQTDTVLTDASRVKLFARYRENYACGWEVFEFDDGMRCIGHGGSVRGYVSKLWWFPNDGALLIVLSNNDAFDYSLLNALRAVLFSPGESGPPRP
jgi:CubicO group peptidase (beta-lactamase class C family)